MAIQIGAGNLSGAMASNFYRASDGPKYTLGHALELGLVAAGISAAVIMRLAYQRINKSRDEEGTGGLTEEEMSKMGDKAPSIGTRFDAIVLAIPTWVRVLWVPMEGIHFSPK